jgi:hypothetical protein
MGQQTSQQLPNNGQQPQQGQVPQQGQQAQQPAAQVDDNALTPQDFKSQMQAMMAKLQQIQQQEPPPESQNAQPGVSG